MSNDNNFEIKHLAEQKYRRKVITRIISFIISGIVFILMAVFLSGQLAEKEKGMFEVTSYNKGDVRISLSDTADFVKPTTVITCQSLDDMDNISQLRDIPADVDSHDGSHNGENYFAHTFYLRNTGDLSTNVLVNFNIINKFKGAEKAMYVRLYRDGVPTTYAHAAEDGSPEYGTVPFFSEDKVMTDTIVDLKPGQTKKFTIVLWLEGDDPDCTDDIMGGFVRFSMDFITDIGAVDA